MRTPLKTRYSRRRRLSAMARAVGARPGGRGYVHYTPREGVDILVSIAIAARSPRRGGEGDERHSCQFFLLCMITKRVLYACAAFAHVCCKLQCSCGLALASCKLCSGCCVALA